MAKAVEIGSLIDNHPKIAGGRPKIAGTGISVMRLVIFYQSGHSPEEIAAEYPHINLAQVHAALAYYHANRAEIDSAIADERAFFAAAESSQRAG